MTAVWLLAGTLVCAAPAAAPALPVEGPGVLVGVVVNGSDENSPVPRAEVVLRIYRAGQFIPWTKTLCDEKGRFRLERLPVVNECLYLPGANRHGVHYPGPRVQLTAAQPRAAVRLTVYDALESPSPLVLRLHEVTLRADAHALRVTEYLRIDNPTRRCYVGQPAGNDQPPVTLKLAIPMEFERATFDKEFFGRRFSIGEGGLVTSVPWPPGVHEVRFTYTLARPRRRSTWQRSVDLPCDEFRLLVDTEPGDRVVCNLPSAPAQPRAGKAFYSPAALKPGQQVEVTIYTQTVSPQLVARWAAVALLATAVAAGAITARRARRRARMSCGQAKDFNSQESGVPTRRIPREAA